MAHMCSNPEKPCPHDDHDGDADQAELDYLRFFYMNADFGPADSDVRAWINSKYDKPIPEGYGEEE